MSKSTLFGRLKQEVQAFGTKAQAVRDEGKPFTDRACVASLLCALAVSACDRDVTAPSPPPKMMEKAASSASIPVEVPARPLFTTDLQIAFPQSPIDRPAIRVLVTATFDVSDADIAVAIPEADLSDTRGIRRPARLNVRVPRLHEWKGALQEGITYRNVTQLALPAPGLYRVHLRAKSDAFPLSADGVWIQTMVHRELWIWSDESGIRVAQDSALLQTPDSVKRLPGPRQFRRPPHVPAYHRGNSRLPPITRMAWTSTAAQYTTWRGLLVWYDRDVQSYVSAGAQTGIMRVYDNYEARYVYTGWVYSAADGSFQIDCPYPGGYESYEYEWQEYSPNFNFYPFPGLGGVYLGPSDGCPSGDMGLNSDRMKILTNLNTIVPTAHSFFQRSRAPVPVRLDYGSDSRVNSYYEGGGTDRITIEATTTSNGVWGTNGRRVQAHEYGHAFHEKALGGNVAGGQCPEPHFLNQASNLYCAYSEGFADYMPTVAAGGTIGSYTATIEANGYYQAGADNANVEGAVAAFFHDLTDPGSGESWDTMQLPGSYVANIIRTCIVKYGLTWPRANGIDHLTYCFEQQVDPAVTGSSVYFRSRSSDPSQQSNSAGTPGGWSRSAIRSNWRRNLYQQ